MIIEHRKKYNNIDVAEHVSEYKRRKSRLREKYENRRIENLKRLGLVEGRPQGLNVSFNSKLWMMGDADKTVT